MSVTMSLNIRINFVFIKKGVYGCMYVLKSFPIAVYTQVCIGIIPCDPTASSASPIMLYPCLSFSLFINVLQAWVAA